MPALRSTELLAHPPLPPVPVSSIPSCLGGSFVLQCPFCYQQASHHPPELIPRFSVRLSHALDRFWEL